MLNIILAHAAKWAEVAAQLRRIFKIKVIWGKKRRNRYRTQNMLSIKGLTRIIESNAWHGTIPNNNLRNL